MTAVAVWRERPSAATMLAARLETGWKPMPSALRTGERVLGYAACVVTGEHRAR